MESIAQALNIRNNCIVSEISRGLENSRTRNNIINVLGKYDINVLTELRNLIDKDTNIYYNEIMERRMAYVNNVRRRRMQQNNDPENAPEVGSGFIDLSRNQDDTENLCRGLNIMFSAKKQVDTIIQNKQNIINMEIQNKKSKELMNLLVSFVVAICIGFLLQNNLIKL